MADKTGGARVRFRVRIESMPDDALDKAPSKPSVRVSGFSSKIDNNDGGRLVISSFMVGVKASSGISSDDIDSNPPDLSELLRPAVQAAAGRVWVAVLEDLAEEASPSRPGRPPGRVTGALFESIRIEIDDDGLGASIGSNLNYAIHLEFGTMDVTARPFLIPALERNKRVIKDIIELAASNALGIRGPEMAERALKQGLAKFEAYKGIVERNFDPEIGIDPFPDSPIFDSLRELAKPPRKSDDSIISVR